MKKPLFYIFCLILMVVLLANGCQKKTGTLDQLQNETVISNEEESLHYDPSDKSTVDSNLTPEINIGIVNDNAVRVRDEPSLDAAIIGRLDQGMTVSVLGRSQNRMFLDGYDSYWLRIRKDDIEGWSYGAYINLTNTQYDRLPVLQDDPDHPFVFIRGERITLRYSTRDDVEKLLGSPSMIYFFEWGGEGFYWRNFTACTYGSDTLGFHYDQDGAVIRIYAYAEYYGEVQFLGKNIKSLIREDIINVITNNMEEDDYDISDNSFISYDYKLSPDVQIAYTFRFYDTGRIRWIDMYYPWSWDEEN